MRARYNDKERELWVMNDEGLYGLYCLSGLSVRDFIRSNRIKIDKAIDRVLRREPQSGLQHY